MVEQPRDIVGIESRATLRCRRDDDPVEALSRDYLPERVTVSSPALDSRVDRNLELLHPAARDDAVHDPSCAHISPPAGRAAFYAAARQIYLEAPHGKNGFWTRLRGIQPDALFVWGRRDTLVPIAFARHVAEALPDARHLELDCGHVPQVEQPQQTHDAVRAFFAKHATVARGDDPAPAEFSQAKR